jgi:hypothetical protein
MATEFDGHEGLLDGAEPEAADIFTDSDGRQSEFSGLAPQSAIEVSALLGQGPGEADGTSPD